MLQATASGRFPKADFGFAPVTRGLVMRFPERIMRTSHRFIADFVVTDGGTSMCGVCRRRGLDGLPSLVSRNRDFPVRPVAQVVLDPPFRTCREIVDFAAAGLPAGSSMR
ncbi:hypothetical protein [Methylobacterium oryzihabitans]|uniref:Uncharacterized protein n=1 Tax=Methylobacterium oryzihabitans TaxID=2499852 RepID=A0A3S2WCC3_9HYPH|nr:hypothetical protein [Methylobacterium oryzihabitans]RVU19081.1 hypothetical protein EOE48_09295 [Methylobacterium oryzihabitans]